MSISLADGGGDFSREGRYRPIEVAGLTYIETVAAESYPLFILLRHRALRSPIYLSEVIRKPFPYHKYSSYPAEGKVSFS